MRQRGTTKDVLTDGEKDKSRKGDEEDVGKQPEEDVEAGERRRRNYRKKCEDLEEEVP